MKTPLSAKKILLVILFASCLAIFLLFYLVYGFDGTLGGTPQTFLPWAIASCNALSAMFVMAGLVRIKKEDKEHHKKFMLIALTASTLFLVLYLARHTLYGDQLFQGRGVVRPIYFSLLVTHILGSIICLPLVLATATFAFLKRWDEHRKWANRTWGLWLWVSVSGVAVFLFLKSFS